MNAVKFGTLNRPLQGIFSTWSAGERVEVKEVDGRASIQRVDWKGWVPRMNQMSGVPLDAIDLE